MRRDAVELHDARRVHGGDRVQARDTRLARPAAVVDACAADVFALDQRGAMAGPRQGGAQRTARLAGADDDGVVMGRTHESPCDGMWDGVCASSAAISAVQPVW